MDTALVEERAVQVTNISPNATQKTVSDFFSFCGKIAKLFLKKEDTSDTYSAVVQFETESAAKTALLLTNALIIDRPIVVAPFKSAPSPVTAVSSTTTTTKVETNVGPELGTEVPASNITHRDFNVPDEQRTKTSVIASLLSAGFILGKDAFDKAKEVDEKHHISPSVKEFATTVKTKAQEFDDQYKISQTVNTVTTAIADKVKQINEEYRISEKAQEGITMVKQEATKALSNAQENQTIARGIDTVKNSANKIANTVVSTVNQYKEETQKVIAQKEKERAKEHPDITVPIADPQPSVVVPSAQPLPEVTPTTINVAVNGQPVLTTTTQ